MVSRGCVVLDGLMSMQVATGSTVIIIIIIIINNIIPIIVSTVHDSEVASPVRKGGREATSHEKAVYTSRHLDKGQD